MNPHHIELKANQPFFLTASDRVWEVVQGEVEVFYADLDPQRAFKSPRNFLYRAGVGERLFSLQTHAYQEGLALLVVSSDATLLEMPVVEIGELDIPTLSSQLEGWITKLSASLYEGTFPRVYQNLEAGQQIELKKGEVAYPSKGILWGELEKGNLQVYSNDALPHTATITKTPVPISHSLWVKAKQDETVLTLMETEEVLENEFIVLRSLRYLQAHFLDLIRDQYIGLSREANENIHQKLTTDEQTITQSLTQLKSIVLAEDATASFADVSTNNLLLAACQLVGKETGFEFTAPSHQDENEQNTLNQLFAIGQLSNARIRKVILRGKWWKNENGHLLGFAKEDKRPLALIQSQSGDYVIKDPKNRTSVPLTEELAAEIDPISYMFFYSFDEQITSLRKLWNFAIKGLKKEGSFILLAALAGSLLGLLVPILSGILFDDVIPHADRSFLWEIFGIMVMIGVVTTLLGLTKGVLLLRIETKSNINVQAGLMDHLLRLPVTFYRKFSAGDLTMRALGINSLRQILAGTVLTAVLSGAFSIVNLALLFWYDSSLAWVGIGLAMVAVAFIAVIGVLKLKYDRQIADQQGDIQGLLFEFLSGINKIRITGGEKRIFSLWANRFAEFKSLGFKSGNYQNFVEVFYATYPLLTRIFFFGCLFYWMTTASLIERTMISVGAFMAFVSAFSQFLNDCLNLSLAMISSLNMIPLYERVKPILEAVPESTENSTDPGELMGDIELNSINFRYEEDQPLVLKDVSLKIKPGEMVAFVGPSGSGKSTIMRILLGFEEPEAGSTFYDGQAFDSLNKDLVRRQVGVVLQNGSLMAGSIYKNIVGNSELGLERAWEAARMAGLEEDIKQMPMEMHTVISEGAGTFSGGQRQRLMIARAIVHKPRMLFMDEATSALDNRTQNIVSESLDRLQATRIVIAHRLSTVINADRIFVMESGKIVESGTYDELMEQDGLFSNLAKRQIA